MADATYYVDGTAVGGVPDGLTWATAWQGNTGLQTALDAVVDHQDTIIYVRNTFTITTGIDIDVGGGDESANKWLTIIGCDASGDELTLGNYVTLDAQDNNLGKAIITIDDFRNIKIKHVWVKDNNGAAGNTDSGFSLSNGASNYNYTFINCKTTGCHRGLYASSLTRSMTCIDCYFEGNGDYASYDLCYSSLYYNCYFTANVTYITYLCYGSTCVQCVFDGSSYSSHTSGYYTQSFINCTFYSYSAYALYVNATTSLGGVVCINCLAVPDAASDDFFNRNAGSINFQDYNFLAATDDPLLDGNSKVNVTVAFEDAASQDFRLKYIIDSGGTYLGSVPGNPDVYGQGTRPGALAPPTGRPLIGRKGGK